MKRALKIWLALNIAGVVMAHFARGRTEANAHPTVRGGGDHGFGGLDFYGVGVGGDQ